MGRLAGFRYRQIVKRLKKFGFAYDRQAAGSHEIWYKEETDSYTTIPNHPGDIPEVEIGVRPRKGANKYGNRGQTTKGSKQVKDTIAPVDK